ncbi:MAG: hypothetical protein NVV74_20820 [Magnetospirillum sp.]|nr:hypothetical protein [Magnetospirillum sp.]
MMADAADALILIVEDSATQALKLQHVLESEGFRTVCAYSAEEALEEPEPFAPQPDDRRLPPARHPG